MKIILSRKGFDSSAGGCPSPIFPDGRLLSLPIPSSNAPVQFSDLDFDGWSLGDVVKSLSNGNIAPTARTHMDPDLSFGSMNRKENWLPAFGQTDAAQSHLSNNCIGIGDLFLFFGWFRRVIKTINGWRYEPGAPDQHVIFGWLQIGEILNVGENVTGFSNSHPWLHLHPHLHGEWSQSNTIYIAKKELKFPGIDKIYAGGGTFSQVRSEMILTAENQTNRSLWTLPDFFFPNERTPLSYHKAPSRWTKSADGRVYLQSVGRGQEFILDAKKYPESINWAETLISGN